MSAGDVILRVSFVIALLAIGSTAAFAQVSNVKVVTDANPDYSDIGSLIYSATDNWTTPKEKCWALFYWNHIARRQTAYMILHGVELTDPIMQFNDYGYTICSTISGINCGIWGAMGIPVKFWDITNHTVAEVEYYGSYHMYDNSMSAIYTLCDGKTIAGVTDIGAALACEKSGGKLEPGHIALYHCLNATSENGWLTGSDTDRSLQSEYRCFNPNGLKYRYYFNSWELGHRYILNLREGEVYTRYYHRLDADSPEAVAQDDKGAFKSDPAYYVPCGGKDLESANPRYHLRGNGIRTFRPPLAAGEFEKAVYSAAGVRATESGIEPAEAGKPGEVIYSVQGSNVITSIAIDAALFRRSAADVNAISISTTNGLSWKEIWHNGGTGDAQAQLKLVEEVNGAYEVLVKVELVGASSPSDARLASIAFKTITALNSKTQPSLRFGKNTVYVGAGDQTGSVVLWPELQGDAYKKTIVEEHNVATDAEHLGYTGVLYPTKPGEDGWVVYRIDAPEDLTTLTYGGRFYNRAPNSHIDLLHSLDGGKTWVKTYSLTDTSSPWDVIHYEKVEIPAGRRSALVKYLMNSSNPSDTGHGASVYSVRMEGAYVPADAGFKPLEVTFEWAEREADYSLVRRSHTQLVEKAPFTYTINVGGADHPVVDSLRVNLKGAAGEVRYGYSDGRDAGGEKFTDRWAKCGLNLAKGRPYTVSVPSEANWGAGDPDGTKLTDGVVGAPYTGGGAYAHGAIWKEGQKPVITVDLGAIMKCGAFRIQVGGYPWWDAIKGEVTDKVEVLTSTDGENFTSRGFFDFNLRWKDVPANHFWTDEETFRAHNFELILDEPVGAQYVRFALTPARLMSVSEVQVYDYISYEPFDLRVALPDGKDCSNITDYLPTHVPSRPYERPRQ